MRLRRLALAVLGAALVLGCRGDPGAPTAPPISPAAPAKQPAASPRKAKPPGPALDADRAGRY